MKRLGKLLILGVLMAAPLGASAIDESEAIEKVGIAVEKLKICHQHAWRNMSIELDFEVDDTTDALGVKEHVREFLDGYSNPDDFWEVMNTKLVRSLTETFPEMMRIESRIHLDPDERLTFPRESIVTYEKESESLHEAFTFTKLDHHICEDSFERLDLHVTWEMQENPSPFDYPDYQWVDEAMDAFFAEQPISFSKWRNLKPALEATLLEEFPSITSINIEVTIGE